MASNNNNNVVAVSFFMILAGLLFSSPANAYLPILGGLNVTGVLCCTANLFCPAGGAPPLGGVPVKLNCTDISGITRTIAQTVTVANGTFSISVSPLAGLLLRSPLSSLIPCTLTVQLPLAATTNCSLFSNNTNAGGILTAPVQAVGGLTSTLLGLVQNAAAGIFSLLILTF